MKNLEFEPRAFEDLAWWIRQDRKIALRIMLLIENIQQMPFEGLGKPEPLKHEWTGEIWDFFNCLVKPKVLSQPAPAQASVSWQILLALYLI